VFGTLAWRATPLPAALGRLVDRMAKAESRSLVIAALVLVAAPSASGTGCCWAKP